ncbi:MAG: hypothetical protein AABX63_05380, partial [Nanoarchaeota archaeon]
MGIKSIKEEVGEIAKLRKEGLTIEEIAKEIGSNYEHIRNTALNFKIMKPRNIPDRLGEEGIGEFKKLYLSGRYYNHRIAEKLLISVPSVKRLAKQLQLPNKYSLNHPAYKKRFNLSIYLYKKGLGCNLISKKIGWDPETIRRYIHDAGIEMRTCGGKDKKEVERQNKIIKRLYLKGVKLEDIEKAAGIGKHGIDKRLKSMGIPRTRHPYNNSRGKYDHEARELFLKGLNFAEISRQIRNANGFTGCGVKYRLNKMFAGFKFKIDCKLNGSWIRGKKIYRSFRALRNGRDRIKRNKSEEIRIVP